MEVDGAPDLTDFMSDWFFGMVGARHSDGGYDLTGESSKRPASPAGKNKQGKSGGGSASKQTQDWLEEAKRMVGAGSPGRMGSPSRQVPRFAGGSGTTEPSPTLDRRDPMSRSARRNWQPGGIGDEILQRASLSSPPRSDPFASSAPPSPTPSLPPNPQLSRRKSRFRDGPTPESPHRRTTSTSTSPTSAAHSRHRRRASASSAPAFAADGFDNGVARLNSFLHRQRAVIDDLATGNLPASRPTKLVLSDTSKSVSSIVAALCYAWMLSSKGGGQAAVPVVNMRRSRMARCRQAAWLLYHVGIDASVLLFADEVSSVCTILTSTYCEDAYSLLQSLDIKKFLLAGILLDTSNLSKKCTNRDSEAVCRVPQLGTP
ncbi:uncharacterized protein LOC120709003 isoform X1 [Panicum virgatum]|uniref:uncharacterized protein LOC120709003 isoform X1 n=1 Tax=Panicum virgatum TaxID=38727 RepID=UPI0019D4F3CB|nr:uncharacterized protein LOC120709003 isoform X1 [Panicum virgatum]